MPRNNLISSIAYHQPICNPLIGTDADRHRHVRELAADCAGMHMSVLGSYEGCGTEPGAHVRLQTQSIARHSSQTRCTRAPSNDPHISAATSDVSRSVHAVQVFPAPNNAPSFIGALHG